MRVWNVGKLVGSLAVLSDKPVRRTATCLALTEVNMLVIHKDDFSDFNSYLHK